MPFIGKDWRSSGNIWIKTPNGWRKAALLRQKLLENLTQSILLRFFRRRMADDCADITIPALHQHPQVFLNKVGTRKVIAPEIDEALELMDIASSVHDLRRVQFVLLLTKLLIEKFADLSVQAQKTVICILGELVAHCEKTDMDNPAVRRLISNLETTLSSSRFIHMSNAAVVSSRNSLLNCYRNRLDSRESMKPYSTSEMNITDLPDDCIIAIAYRLVDPCDLLRLGATCKKMKSVCSNQHLWHCLCELYFTQCDLARFRESSNTAYKQPYGVKDANKITLMNWRSCCLRMYRPYRLHRYFADQPLLCQSCWCVFWKLSGHKCALQSKAISYSGRDVSPSDFLQLLVLG